MQAAADRTDHDRSVDGPDGETVKVTSTSANGWVSDAGEYDAHYDTSPTVNSDLYVENQTSGGGGGERTAAFTAR